VGRYYWYNHDRAERFGYAPAPARDALTRTVSWLAGSPHISMDLRAQIKLAPEVYAYRSGPS
jgi:dihydroflavonol-4-reductase